MRQLTETEKSILNTRCVFCEGTMFYMGPQGGVSYNIYCAECHAGYNVTHQALPWQLISAPDAKTLLELQPVLRSVPMALPLLYAGIAAEIEDAITRGVADFLRRRPTAPE